MDGRSCRGADRGAQAAWIKVVAVIEMLEAPEPAVKWAAGGFVG